MSLTPSENENQAREISETTEYTTDVDATDCEIEIFRNSKRMKSFVNDDSKLDKFAKEFGRSSKEQQEVLLRHAKGALSYFENKNGPIAFSMVGAGATLIFVKSSEILPWLGFVAGFVFLVSGTIVAKFSPLENKNYRRLEAFIAQLERILSSQKNFDTK